MYYEGGIRQPQIAAELNMSQARVSRLLRQASDIGVVRTVVTLPPGVYTDLEEKLQAKFGLKDAVIVDADGAGGQVIPALGAATAQYLHATLIGGEVLGVSSWSATLLAAAEAMPARTTSPLERVVADRRWSRRPERAGPGERAHRRPGRRHRRAAGAAARAGAGQHPGAATGAGQGLRHRRRHEVLEGTRPRPGRHRQPGAVAAAAAKRQRAQRGRAGPAPQRRSGRRRLPAVLRRQRRDARHAARSARGEHHPGRPHAGAPAHRHAGGTGKYRAIRAALRGGWVNVLIADLDTARGLAEDADSPVTAGRDLQPAIDPERFSSCQVSRWNRCASSTTATRSASASARSSPVLAGSVCPGRLAAGRL